MDIETQTLMRDMPNTRMEGYNEMVLEFGWINLFAPVFPAAALLAIFSNILQLKSEKDSIGRFTKRGTPIGALDIGGWLEYFQFLSVIGTINSVGLIIFTSQQLENFGTKFGDYTRDQLIITVFIVENLLIAFRFLLSSFINDYPEWIEKDIFNQENRVKQINQIIEKKEIEAKINPEVAKDTIYQDDTMIAEDIMSKLHHDRDLASALLPKIVIGCDDFYDKFNEDGDHEDKSESSEESKFEEVINPKTKMPFEKKELKKKLKVIRKSTSIAC